MNGLGMFDPKLGVKRINTCTHTHLGEIAEQAYETLATLE